MDIKKTIFDTIDQYTGLKFNVLAECGAIWQHEMSILPFLPDVDYIADIYSNSPKSFFPAKTPTKIRGVYGCGFLLSQAQVLLKMAALEFDYSENIYPELEQRIFKNFIKVADRARVSRPDSRYAVQNAPYFVQTVNANHSMMQWMYMTHAHGKIM